MNLHKSRARIVGLALLSLCNTVVGSSAQVQVDILSYHDDPIVVDNAPVSIRLGANPMPRDTPGAPNSPLRYTWTREVTEFVTVTSTRFRADGSFDGYKGPHRVCVTSCRIELELEPIGPGTTVGFVNFTIPTTGTLVMDTGEIKFDIDAQDGRLKPVGQYKDQLRVKRVSAYNKDNRRIVHHPFDTKTKHLHVDIVMKPELTRR